MSKKIRTLIQSSSTACVFIFSTSLVLVIDTYLFNISKSSFLTGLDWRTQILQVLEGLYFFNYLLTIPFIFLLTVLIVVTPARYCEVVMRRGAVLLTSIIFSATIFLVIEKMIYSFFSIGILESHSSGRIGFVVFYIFILYVSYAGLSRQYLKIGSGDYYKIRIVISALVALSFIVGFGSAISQLKSAPKIDKNYPSIILISGDGIRTNNMSAYGYHKPTTPFLDSFKDQMLIAKNAFANNAGTGGSLVSVLTGMNPATTHAFDIGKNLRKEHAKKSLPALLKGLGYQTYSVQSQISPPVIWTDTTRRNMQNAFDYPNSIRQQNLKIIPKVHFSLTRDILGNALLKLGHLFYILDAKKPFSAVTTPNTLDVDRSIMEDALSVIQNSKQPFFLQLHLMGPHGPLFETDSKYFSGDQIQDRPGHPDFYDDAIRDFDIQVKRLHDAIAKSGKAENLIWVIFSDHGMAHSVSESVPLMFRFPDQQHRGSVHQIAQLLDIAPTVLNYLGEPIPDWMDGHSLLNPKLPSGRPIYAFSNEETKESYFIESASRIQCDHIAQINFSDHEIGVKFLKEGESDCQSDWKTPGKSFQALLDYLKAKDISVEEYEFGTFKGYELFSA